MRPEDALLLGVSLLAALFFAGGAIEVFGVPVSRKRREQGYPQKESVLWPHHLSSLTPKTFLPYTKEQWGCQAPILSIEGLISCPR